MTQDKAAAVAIFDNHDGAEDAVRTLQQAGLDMKKISIVAKGYHTDEQVVGYYNTGDRVTYWGGTGALWGGLWGLLLGSAFFAVPGIGPLVIGGPLVAAIVSGLESAVLVGGLSALGAALYSIGIPKDSVLRYETALRADKYLVVVNGTSDDVAKATDILRTSKATTIDEHAAVPTVAA
jgi:hypothetical protein